LMVDSGGAVSSPSRPGPINVFPVVSPSEAQGAVEEDDQGRG